MNYNTEMKFAELTETEVMNIEGGATYGSPGQAPKMTDYDMSTTAGVMCYYWDFAIWSAKCSAQDRLLGFGRIGRIF